MALQSNISGTTVTSVLAAGDNVSKIQAIRITNTHASADATVDLFINSDSFGTFYIIKNVLLPYGTSLVLEKGLSFDNSTNGYNLYAKLGDSSSTVDIIITK